MSPARKDPGPAPNARLRSAALIAVGGAALGLALATLLWPHPPAPPPPSTISPSGALEEREGAGDTPPSPAQAPLPTLIVIPRIGVAAPLTVRGVGLDGAMEDPLGPEDVAWYDFTARPGEGGNAVFSGHLDYRGYGAAVFADLYELRAGDLVEVHGADGSLFRYRVAATAAYPAEPSAAAQVLAPTGREMVTLITCAGTFRGPALGYSHRFIVRAERV